MNKKLATQPGKGTPSLTLLGAAVAAAVFASVLFLQSANADKPADVSAEKVSHIKY